MKNFNRLIELAVKIIMDVYKNHLTQYQRFETSVLYLHKIIHILQSKC